MSRSTAGDWLDGPDDLKEADVEDVPVKGKSVRVRQLPGYFSSEAASEAVEIKLSPKGDQIQTINNARFEVLKFAHGVVDPPFTVDQAEQIAKKYGNAFNRVIEKIDDLSELSDEDVEKEAARFQDERESADGADLDSAAPNGSGGPDVPLRVGA